MNDNKTERKKYTKQEVKEMYEARKVKNAKYIGRLDSIIDRIRQAGFPCNRTTLVKGIVTISSDREIADAYIAYKQTAQDKLDDLFPEEDEDE